MSAEQQTVWVLVCDGCNEKLTDADYEGEIVAEDVERIREIAEDSGWSRSDDDDLCPTCTCARAGHERRVSASGTYAYCDRCSETLLDSVTTADPKAAYL